MDILSREELNALFGNPEPDHPKPPDVKQRHYLGGGFWTDEPAGKHLNQDEAGDIIDLTHDEIIKAGGDDLKKMVHKIEIEEFGSLIMPIYEEQYKDIREAYLSYENDDIVYDCKIAKTYHKFFKALFEALGICNAEENEVIKEHVEELERMRVQLDKVTDEDVKNFDDAINNMFNNGNLNCH